ncbi:1525_t:CDS:2, partial [Cetraspora pellucida]
QVLLTLVIISISKKLVILEDESLSTNSNIELMHKNNVETANFGYLPVKLLKFLCYEMGVSESGSKQNLVDHLVNKSQKKLVLLALNTSGKNKEVDVDNGIKKILRKNNKLNFKSEKAFANVFNKVSETVKNFEIKEYNNQFSLHLLLLATEASCNWDIKKAGLLLDKALATGDAEYVQLARQGHLKGPILLE